MATTPERFNTGILKFFQTAAIIFIGIFLFAPRAFADGEEPKSFDEYARGKVIKIVNEETTEELGEPLVTQKLDVTLTSGPERNAIVSVEYQVRGDSAVKKMSVGDRVIVVKNNSPLGTEYFITEPYRLPAILWLVALFAAVTISFAGRRGAMAFLGLGVTFAIIGFYIIPRITGGDNPFLVCIIGVALIASSSLFLAHGYNRETGLAFVSIMITIIGAMGLAYIAVGAARLFGMGSEEAYYLQFGVDRAINLRGLLLGGIIIGVLGVLDDVTTAQVAAVAELKRANAELSVRELYYRAGRIGREHITSVVNTLVLAYAGASFPLLLLFTVFETPWWVTLNTELLSEEVVRTLIGSIALVAAVPLSTIIAAKYYAVSEKKYENLSQK